VTVTDGRTFTDDDTEANVTVLDASYADTNEIAVGDTIDIGGTDFEVIGLVSSTSSEATTAANAYISLPIAQSLADLDGQLTDIYVQAESSADIAQIQSDIETALPDATVSSQADLASGVSGSLSTASSLVSSLGTWLSVIVLGAAFLIATLFTISGVGRRTREFGTLKAIGWRNGMIVRQVAGESLVQGLIGGVIGIVIGLGGIWVINLLGITLSGATGGTSFAFQGGQAPTGAEMPTDTTGGGFGGGGGQFADAAASTVDIVLHAPVTISVILIAVGLAVLGGLIAGSFGGWRAARLRPAEALRSVA
jgi:ABC-type antimicrobial peptide transport system permease subunit